MEINNLEIRYEHLSRFRIKTNHKGDTTHIQSGGSRTTRHGKVRIRVNKHQWENNQDTLWREMLLFHELSHEILHRGHVPDDSLSIMREAPNVDLYRSNRDKHLDELFQR